MTQTNLIQYGFDLGANIEINYSLDGEHSIIATAPAGHLWAYKNCDEFEVYFRDGVLPDVEGAFTLRDAINLVFKRINLGII